MTRRSLESIECDRCGDTQQFYEDNPKRADWGVMAARAGGKQIIGGEPEPADLCPRCVDAMLRCFRRDGAG